jgi:hypothetical protein
MAAPVQVGRAGLVTVGLSRWKRALGEVEAARPSHRFLIYPIAAEDEMEILGFFRTRFAALFLMGGRVISQF